MPTLPTAAMVLLACLIGGCADRQKLAAPTQTDQTDRVQGQNSQPPPPAAATEQQAVSQQPIPVVIDLGSYQMQVPYGTISRSKPFWKRIKESVVDVATHDLLDKNGVRVGVGEVADWPYFKKILDAAGANTLQGHYIAFSATDQEIPASGDIDEENLFYFDRHGLSGNVYEQCRNLWVMAYGPAPSAAKGVRIEMCPMIRSISRHYHAIVVNGQPTFDYSNDEQLFDLNLRIDLPEGKFLVIAPSPQSERTLSLGYQFLTQDAKPGRKENVLIFVSNPRPVVKPVPNSQTQR